MIHFRVGGKQGNMPHIKLAFEAWTQPMHMAGFDIAWIKPAQKPYYPLDKWAEMLHQYGYEGLSAFWPFFQWMKYKGNYKEETQKMKETLDSLNMGFASIACHSMMGSANPRPWVRDGAVKTFCDAIDVAKDIGAETVTSCTGNRNFHYLDDQESWDLCIESWKKVCKKAEDVGQNITMEICVHDNIVMTPPAAEEFWKEVGSDRLHFGWDTAQMTSGCKAHMSIMDGVKLLGKRINELHLKDMSGGFINEHKAWVWYGYGQVNFEEHFEALKAIGYDGYGSIEYETQFPTLGVPHKYAILDLERVAKDAANFLRKHGLF